MRTALALLFTLGAACFSGAQSSLNWFTIAAGGGTSTGGVYAVSGTIGQPDAGAMTGGEGAGFTGSSSASAS